MSDTKAIPVAILRAFAVRILTAAGLPAGEAAVSAESLVQADMRGVASHGITRLRAYARRIRAGVVAVGVTPRILRDAPAALLVDGGNGMGAPVGLQVMDLCVQRARTQGACFAAVRRGNHFGIGAFFTLHATRQGMVGLAMSNAPASVVPTGGRRAMLGTNPLSIAVPAGRHPPFVLDMATSVVAQGKIILAAKESQASIPDSWAVDESGRPTTDPKAALNGAMLPFGGPKGYAIAFFIEILCSALAGALNGTRIRSFWDNLQEPQDLGYFMGAWNVASLLPPAEFASRVDALCDEMKACPPAPGCAEVLIPGEIEHRKAQQAETAGLVLGPAVLEDLCHLGVEYGVPFDPVTKGVAYD